MTDVSLEVYPGEMVAIVGRRGAGKSTLLSILGCIQRPDSGELHIGDLDVIQLADAQLAWAHYYRLGYLYPDIKLEAKETGLANVETILMAQGFAERERRQMAWAAIRAVGLESRHVELKLGMLSAGQRLGVAMARALVHEPPVLFADEPTRALDNTAREEVMGLFQKLSDEGRAVVIATADASAANYCRRAVRLVEGRIVEDSLVSRRRVVSLDRIPAGRPDMYLENEEGLCPRCSYNNPADQDICQRCTHRLRGAENGAGPVGGAVAEAIAASAVQRAPAAQGEVAGPVDLDELKTVPFFGRLGIKSLVSLMPSMELLRFPQGSTIVRQGDAGDCFYVVRSGSVQVEAESLDGPDVQVAQIGVKEGFGEMALLTD